MQAKSHFRLPDWDGKTVSKNTDLPKFDRSYDNQFVLWYQNTKDVFNSSRYLVEKSFYYCGKRIRMCLECMKFKREMGKYCKIYYCEVQSLSFCNEFVTCAYKWHHVCKCAPLFQALASSEVKIEYCFDPVVHEPFHKI